MARHLNLSIVHPHIRGPRTTRPEPMSLVALRTYTDYIIILQQRTDRSLESCALALRIPASIVSISSVVWASEIMVFATLSGWAPGKVFVIQKILSFIIIIARLLKVLKSRGVLCKALSRDIFYGP